MTTPTPAQIEAAAKAVRQMGQCINIAADDYEEIARVVLTAAAQAGEQAVNHKDLSRYIQSIGRTIEAATIERCAQMAENWKQGGSTESNGIAAAIRKLKYK